MVMMRQSTDPEIPPRVLLRFSAVSIGEDVIRDTIPRVALAYVLYRSSDRVVAAFRNVCAALYCFEGPLVYTSMSADMSDQRIVHAAHTQYSKLERDDEIQQLQRCMCVNSFNFCSLPVPIWLCEAGWSWLEALRAAQVCFAAQNVPEWVDGLEAIIQTRSTLDQYHVLTMRNIAEWYY